MFSPKEPLKVFIGFDQAEKAAADVAVFSMLRRASVPVSISLLKSDRLRESGMLRRLVDSRGGRHYDLTSNAHQSTEFAISRFLTPLLSQSGPALFLDCDMLFQQDVADLFALFDPSKAVQVVKHYHVPSSDTKMVNKLQIGYHRKNWSSVMLFNCDHKANRRLSLDMINNLPGRDLHAFIWLSDEEIGDLPRQWNWLVDEQDKPDAIGIAHYTNGGPWFSEWESRPSDKLWLDEFDAMNKSKESLE